MTMTFEEAIKHAEEVAIEQAYLMSRYDAASGYARSGNEAIRTESAKKCEQCAAEHRQLAEWLKELAERRKQPEIILCGECKYYKIDHPKANGYHCCYRCHNIFPMKEDDFCSRGERRI